MRFSDYISSAYKNLTRQKARSVLTIIAITVGSLSLILMASLIIGIRQSLVEQFQNLGAFNLVTVTKDPNSTDQNNLMGTSGDTSEGKLINDATLASVKKLSHVESATPVLSGIGIGTMKLEGQERKTWPNLIAYDPTTSVFEIPLIAGRNITTSDMDKIVIGSRFLEDMKMTGKGKELIGKKVIMNSKMGGGGGSGIDWGPAPEKPPINADEEWYKSQNNNGIDIEAEIVGVADNGTVGDGSSYINLAWARRLNTQVSWQWDKEAQQKDDQVKQAAKQQSKENGTSYSDDNRNNQNYMILTKNDNFAEQGYTSIVMKVDDTKNLTAVAEEITKIGYGAVTAQDMLDQINKIFTMIGAVLAVIAGISLFVAAIGIINTMIMATYERIREIGVMRACGATRAVIRRLFTFEAAMLGFWGGVFGLVISVLLGIVARILVQKYGASLGNIPIDNIGKFPWWLILGVVAFTTLIGLFSGLYPAARAAKLNPVEALRYE